MYMNPDFLGPGPQARCGSFPTVLVDLMPLRSGKMTEGSEVFSFGMVLLEASCRCMHADVDNCRIDAHIIEK